MDNDTSADCTTDTSTTMGGTTSDSISNCQPSDTFSHCQSSNTNTWNNNPATSYNEAIVCYNTEQPSTTLPEQWEDMNNRSSSLEMLSRPPSYTTATSPRITLPRPTLQMNDHGVQYIIIPVPGNQSTNQRPSRPVAFRQWSKDDHACLIMFVILCIMILIVIIALVMTLPHK